MPNSSKPTTEQPPEFVADGSVVVREGVTLTRPLSVHQAIAEVMRDVSAVGKGSTADIKGGPTYKFRGIDAVVNAVGPAFRRHGVICLPSVQNVDYEVIPTKQGGTQRQCTMRVRFTFVGPAGDTLDCTVYGESADSGDKSTTKAHSVAYRTALLQALCLPTDQPDPDEHNFERGAPEVEDPAVPGLRSSIEGAIAKLSDDEKAELKAWFAANGLPAVRRMNAAQADAVLEHLIDVRTGMTEPSEGSDHGG